MKMLNKEDHKYLAMGEMAGFLAIPVGVLASGLSIIVSEPFIRSAVASTGIAANTLRGSLKSCAFSIDLYLDCLGSL